MSILANRWAAQGHIIRFVDIAGDGSAFYRLDPRIEFYCLHSAGSPGGSWQSVVETLRRVWKLRPAILAWRPDVTISFCDLTNILTLLALTGTKAPTIVSERVQPLYWPLSDLGWVDSVWRWMRKVTYRRAGALVVQTNEIGRYFEPFRLKRIAVIANPVDILATMRSPMQTAASIASLPDGPLFLGVGRLSSQKNFALLIGAFARLSNRHPDWHLVIVGEGPDRAELEAAISRHGLGTRILLLGNVRDMQAIFRRTDIFVLSSRFEGFPNALCEAMVHGVAVIATDCPGAIREIVQPGINGLVVANENEEALAAAMARLMADRALRERFAAEAQKTVSRFSSDRVIAEWEHLIEGVVEKSFGDRAPASGVTVNSS